MKSLLFQDVDDDQILLQETAAGSAIKVGIICIKSFLCSPPFISAGI